MSEVGAPRKRPTLAGVASAAGVSLATVSKVLNGREDVAEDTRAHVLRMLEQHDYVASPKRRKPGVRRTIGLVFDDFMSPYATELIRGVTDTGGELDIDVVVGRFSGPSAPGSRTRTWAQRLSSAGRDGVVIVTSDLDPGQVRSFQKAHLPLVVIDPVHTPEAEVTSIGVTNWTGGLSATEHLIGLGHQRIAYLGGPSEAAVNLARRHGYRAAMERAGLPCPPELAVDAGFGFEAGVRTGSHLLDLAERPTAVFAVTDVTALGVIQAAHSRGLRVPEDLSVVGFDDTYMAEWATPALTTVHTPLQDVGRLAVRTLKRLMEGETVDSHHIELATNLVVRDSTTQPPP
ncbi:LacI family transcriptional regulator [Motilibacter peucedani]|uniref:LacI family transcriptional regulator n=1 Tax=Motilibacter peucedani TaxID=598650 RepID=A0A420XRH7_9ACTN|nr:LacI family DNA-binding transcriptional regulator [Motilibacter peucedani]RKS77464.1 LacI family transcriptional regulator [Motilibacter peucedani]